MRPSFGTFGLVLFSATALAQSGGAPPQQAAAVSAMQRAMVVAQDAQGCPANLTTSHLPGASAMQVRPTDGTPVGPLRPDGAYRAGFRVDVLQTALQNRHIVQARVTFHGHAGQALLPAAGQTTGGDVTESFTIAGSTNDHEVLHSTVYTSKMLALQWVELNEVTYADGHIWKEPTAGQCHFQPNGFMLVAAQ